MKKVDESGSMESKPLTKSPAQEDMDIRSGVCPNCQKSVQYIKNKPVNHVCSTSRGRMGHSV